MIRNSQHEWENKIDGNQTTNPNYSSSLFCMFICPSLQFLLFDRLSHIVMAMKKNHGHEKGFIMGLSKKYTALPNFWGYEKFWIMIIHYPLCLSKYSKRPKIAMFFGGRTHFLSHIHHRRWRILCTERPVGRRRASVHVADRSRNPDRWHFWDLPLPIYHTLPWIIPWFAPFVEWFGRHLTYKLLHSRH